MRRCSQRMAVVLVLGASVALASQARALAELQMVTPANAAAEGFKVTAVPRDSGMLRFTVTRELAKSPFPARRAQLEVWDGRTFLAGCRVEGEPDAEKKLLSYVVDLPADRVGESQLTVMESPGITDPKRAGSRTMVHYRVRLAAFR